MNFPVQQVQLNSEVDNTVDVAKYLGFIYENKWLIAGVAAVVTLLGLVYALTATPIYRANILVRVEDNAVRPRNIPGDLAGSEINTDVKTAAATEMEVLRSRSVISRALDNGKFYIQVKPNYFPIIGSWIARRNNEISEPGIFGLGGYVWGSESAKVSVFNVPEQLESQRFTIKVEDNGNYRLTQDDIGIDAAGRVGELFTLQKDDEKIELKIDKLDAKRGAQFSLTRVARLDAIEMLQEQLAILEKGKQSGIIEVALENSDPRLASAVLNEIGKAYVGQNLARKSEEAEKTLAFLNAQLPELKRELEQSESKYNSLRNSKGTIDLVEEARNTLQQSVLAQTKMVDLKQRKEELLMRFQPDHPVVKSIDQQLAALEREVAAVEAKVKKLPEVEQSVTRLSRDVKVNTELYSALAGAAQQLRLATESKVGTVRLLDNAVTPINPVKPKRAVVAIVSGIIGLALGIIAAFFRKTVLGRIDTPIEIEERLGLPVAATIPHSGHQEKFFARLQNDDRVPAMLPLDVPSDGTVESLRRFRTSLQFAMIGAKSNIIMIVGATSGVGKSFVSANFAAVLASIGKTVLLVDGDLRSGHLHRYFGRDRKAGLAEVVSGKALFGEAIQRGVAENVDFLSTGELPRKPAEMLAHENFGKLLQLLSSRYDFILIDSAPVLEVSDALVVASHAGAIFNVVRRGRTTSGEVEEAVKRLNQAGHSVTGVVFNDFKQRTTRYGYGHYGRYHYTAESSV